MTKSEFIFIFRVLGITSRNEMKIKLYVAAAARESSLCVNVRSRLWEDEDKSAVCNSSSLRRRARAHFSPSTQLGIKDIMHE